MRQSSDALARLLIILVPMVRLGRGSQFCRNLGARESERSESKNGSTERMI